MKNKFLTAVSVVALSAVASANAADIVRHHEISTVIVQPVHNFSWAGFYLGAQGGYEWGTQKAKFFNSDSNATPAYRDYDVKGGAAGAYAGFNTNLENGAVFGLETDMLWNKLKGDHAYRAGDDNPNDYDTVGLSQKWAGATRLRIGFANDRILPYLAAGIAYTKLTTDVTRYRKDNVPAPVSQDNGDKTYTGWTVGAGLDYAATDNILVRLEYRYSDFGKKDFDIKKEPTYLPFDRINVKYKTQDVRVGVAYKF